MAEAEGERVGVVALVATGDAGAQSVTYSAERDGAADELLEPVVALAADRVRWRRRAELVSWFGDELRTALVVIDGDTFRARRGLDGVASAKVDDEARTALNCFSDSLLKELRGRPCPFHGAGHTYDRAPAGRTDSPPAHGADLCATTGGRPISANSHH